MYPNISCNCYWGSPFRPWNSSWWGCQRRRCGSHGSITMETALRRQPSNDICPICLEESFHGIFLSLEICGDTWRLELQHGRCDLLFSIFHDIPIRVSWNEIHYWSAGLLIVWWLFDVGLYGDIWSLVLTVCLTSHDRCTWCIYGVFVF